MFLLIETSQCEKIIKCMHTINMYKHSSKYNGKKIPGAPSSPSWMNVTCFLRTYETYLRNIWPSISGWQTDFRSHISRWHPGTALLCNAVTGYFELWTTASIQQSLDCHDLPITLLFFAWRSLIKLAAITVTTLLRCQNCCFLWPNTRICVQPMTFLYIL